MPAIDNIVLQPLLCLGIQKLLAWLRRRATCHQICVVTTQDYSRLPLTTTISRGAWKCLGALNLATFLPE
eukprot:1153450-Pelagomonas_calceolata.AAC.3